jgi:hypothetical protein
MLFPPFSWCRLFGMRRTPAPTSTTSTASAVLLALVVAIAISGCARPDRVADPVRPLERSDAPPAPGTDPSPSTADAPARAANDVAPSTPTPTTRPGADSSLQAVASVLADYGEVLGQLSADPAGTPAPGTAARIRWDAVVLADTPLSVDLLDRIDRRVTEDRMVVAPDPDGISFRHVPTAARAASGGAIDFEWCGWSPGIGRSIDTGEVLDDSVAHATGVGRIVLVDGSWRLASLDQEELDLLPPGSPDPCPASAPAGR